MSATKAKKHNHESQEPRSPSGSHKKGETPSKSAKSVPSSAASDLDHSDSINSHATPSKKKTTEAHGKTKAELIFEKSKAIRQNSRSNVGSPKADSSARSHGPTPTKSSSLSSLARKDDSSDSEDEMDRTLRAMDQAAAERAKNAARAPVAAAAAESDSEDDAPVAKSFKDSKKGAMELHQAELDEMKATSAKKKDVRRQRTQLLQEQSKKSQKKEKKRKVESSDDEAASQMDVDDEFELVPESVLNQAVAQTHTHILMDEDEDNRERIERRKQRKAERELERQEIIDSKMVTVVPLGDSTGSTVLQSRKAAAQTAEHFLKEHFWGGRLERMPADHFISERIRGPALQFVVPNGQEAPASRKSSMKENRRAQMKRRR